ncbi:hypothetical protein CsSME_00052975 [Camellia sinensis var. sinensis]
MAISRAMKLFSRSFASLSSTPLRVCIVGSGPAGFYTAEKMLKRHQGAEVDIVDRLLTPYGIVRSGVAPDHPETKIVTNQFSRVAQNERCSFFGNVSLGSSVSLSELREMYHVTRLCLPMVLKVIEFLVSLEKIRQGYTRLENLFGGIMGTMTANIWLQT